jgi:threonine synthase
MTFASKRHPEERVGFREALFDGLAPDGGLYHPAAMPDLSSVFASFDDSTGFVEVASRMGAALLGPEVTPDAAERLARGAFGFSPALRRLDAGTLLLELFHGPTCAFKDFGAQYLAAAMEQLLGEEDRRIQILVATSGDTGSAVARAFHGRAGIDVVILYPSGRVSGLQEQQLTTLGGNVHALEVAGSFDDCQRLVKEAFQDPGLRERLRLTSANSINIGRLIPQCFYYAWAATRRSALGGGAPVVCVPSGNFGNLTAGVYAWRWGLPVAGFIAATNANDVVPAYIRTGRFDPRPSTRTLSNAMDVGNPSNFERLQEAFKADWRDMASRIEGRSVSDSRTIATMAEIHRAAGVLVDPHTAVGCAAAADRLAGVAPGPAPDSPSRPAPSGAEQVIVLSTAHPAKFPEIVRQATGAEPELPERLARCLTLPKQAAAMGTGLAGLSEFLLDSFG